MINWTYTTMSCQKAHKSTRNSQAMPNVPREVGLVFRGNMKLYHPIRLCSLNRHLIRFHKKPQADLSDQHLSEFILWGQEVSISFELGHTLSESIWFCHFPSPVAVNKLHYKTRPRPRSTLRKTLSQLPWLVTTKKIPTQKKKLVISWSKNNTTQNPDAESTRL